MEVELTKEEKLIVLEKAVNGYMDSELFAFVLADLINFVGAEATERAKVVQKFADKKNPVYKKFSVRHAQLNSLLTFSRAYCNSMENRVKEIYETVDFDESGHAISSLMKDLFKMDNTDRESVIMSMEMVKKGKTPTFINFSTIEKQELAKRTKLPLEYIITILSHIPDVCINSTES
jgi:hypothetical protein